MDGCRFFTGKNIGPTLFIDFTKAQCFSKAKDPCRLDRIPSTIRWSWKQLTIKDSNACLNKRILIVRGKDQGRQAWYLAIVFEYQLEHFWAAIRSGHLHVADYGHIVNSGWGEDPPAETMKLWTTYGP